MNKLIFLFLSVLAITGCGESEPIPLEQSKSDYVILDASNSKDVPLFRDRNFGKVFIYSYSENYIERVQTSLLAAKDYLEKESIEYVKVFHLPANEPILIGTGHYIAVAEYAPDGKGNDGKSSFEHETWQARAIQGKIDPLSIEIQVLWYNNREKFQKEDDIGFFTDESALKQFISKKLNNKVLATDIHLPYYKMVKF